MWFVSGSGLEEVGGGCCFFCLEEMGGRWRGRERVRVVMWAACLYGGPAVDKLMCCRDVRVVTWCGEGGGQPGESGSLLGMG